MSNDPHTPAVPMRICAYSQCGKSFPLPPKSKSTEEKRYCDRKCAARANAAASKGTRKGGNFKYAKTCGVRGVRAVRITPFHE